jgi:hypothetical protein
LIHPQPFSLVGNEAAAAALISIQMLMCVCVSGQLKIIMCISFYFIFTHFDLVAGRALFLPMSYIPRPLLPLHYYNNNNNYLLLVFVFFFPSSPGRQRRRRLFG